MPVYELILPGRSNGRFTERKPMVGDRLVIDRVPWVVESEGPSTTTGVEAAFLLKRRVLEVRRRERPPVTQARRRRRAK
jgi:hypothetical protein